MKSKLFYALATLLCALLLLTAVVADEAGLRIAVAVSPINVVLSAALWRMEEVRGRLLEWAIAEARALDARLDIMGALVLDTLPEEQAWALLKTARDRAEASKEEAAAK
ncbi:MAG: hypothetical protein EBT64_07880, partial [Gammaproteobacteria bacterium]|nr:hypothetical protein [Gammaproteobacteria bacterium]